MCVAVWQVVVCFSIAVFGDRIRDGVYRYSIASDSGARWGYIANSISCLRSFTRVAAMSWNV